MDAGAAITLSADQSTWILWLPTHGDESVRFVAATSTDKTKLEMLLDALEQQ